ncbi:MAG: cobalt/nickel transport protein [Euryarchaeota archaeon]|nr:cobalt/nickel transport protein [Euryarchaeota archaeon]
MSRKLELIVLAIILIFAAQFVYMSSTTDAEYGGSDDMPEGVIGELTDGTFKPIAEPIWEPPSGEIESLLFALQAAIGAIIIGYFFGYYRAKSRFESQFGMLGDKNIKKDEKIQV